MTLFDAGDADDGCLDQTAPPSKESCTADAVPVGWQLSCVRWPKWGTSSLAGHLSAEARCWRCQRTECLKLVSAEENRFECGNGETCRRRVREAMEPYSVD